jgi:peptidyl-prolyl cis-trans isomerase C
MRTVRTIAIAVLAALWSWSAAAQEIYVARVDGNGITVQAVEAAFDEMLKEKGLHLLQVRNPAKVKEMKHEALDGLIDDELLWQAASKSGMVADDAAVDAAFAVAAKAAKGEERLRLRLAQEEVSEADYRERIRRKLSGQRYAQAAAEKKVSVGEAEIRDFYKANPDKFHRPEMLRARQILIKVPADATKAQRAQAQSRLRGILAQARAGKDFGELAREHSEDATKQWDGELDPIARGSLPPALEKAAFALKPGEITGIVATPAGLPIVQLEQRIPEVSISEKDAHDRIAAYLRARKTEEAIRELLADLRAGANIEMILPY